MRVGESRSTFDNFVGRERELAELTAALDDARDGRGRLFLLSGEPGIGKTRLAEEVARESVARGMRAVWGRCWEGPGAPAYWPWIQVIRGCINSANLPTRRAVLESEHASSTVETVAQIVPELHASTPHPPKPAITLGVDPEQARFRLFDSVATLLKNFARLGPLTILLDDLHDADSSSLMMLRFVAQEITGANILIVATYRDLEVWRSPELSKHVGDLGRKARSIPLAGLSQAEVAQFVGLSSGQAPDNNLVTKLHSATAGNPLFVEGIVRTLFADRDVGHQAASDDNFKIPHTLRDAIHRRLSVLSDKARSLLNVAAVIGNEFDADVCTQVGGVSRDVFNSLLDDATTVGIVMPLGQGRYRFAHALIRAAIHDALDTNTRTRLHGMIGEAIEEIRVDHLDGHLAELAHHFREAGIAAKAIDYSIRAGAAADCALAFAEAIELWEPAVRLMDQHQADPRGRAGLLQRLCYAAFNIDLAKSLRYAEAALALYDSVGDVERAAQMHSIIGQTLANYDGSPLQNVHRAREHYRRAESVFANLPNSLWLAQLYFRIAEINMWALDLAGGFAAGQRAMEMSEPLEVGDVWVESASVYAAHLFMSGRLTEAFSLWERAYARADEMNHPAAAFRVAMNAGGLGNMLQYPTSRAWLDREQNRPRNAQARWRRQSLSRSMAAAVANEGNLAEARRLIGETVAQEHLRFFEQGSSEKLVNYLEGVVSDASRRGDYFSRIIAQDTLARAYFVREEYLRAETVLQDSLQPRKGGALVVYEMMERPLLARVYAEKNQLEAAFSQLARCREIMAKGEDWRGLTGLVENAEAVVLAASGRFAEADSHFQKAVETASRHPHAYYRAEARYCWGRALNAAGKCSQANENFDAAVEIYRSHGFAQRFIDRVEAARHSSVAKALEAAQDSSFAVFRKEGEFWTLDYQGATFRLKDIKGLGYIAHLLAHPGQKFHVKELAAIVEGVGPGSATSVERSLGGTDLTVTNDLGGATPALDPRARADYRHRLKELKTELDEAESFNDIGRAASIREEIDVLSAELASATGIGGRARQSGTHAERARRMVGKSIHAALDKIRRGNPALGRHFATSISTGYLCTYRPEADDTVSWQLEAE